MHNVKKVITSPFFAIGAFALAAVMLLSAGIGGASAALNDTSDVYQLDIATENIAVRLIENGSPVENERFTLSGLPEDYDLGTGYNETMAVSNTGAIDEYVRVIVYKYWIDAEGNKLTYAEGSSLSPDLIDLGFVTDNGWSIYSQSDERTILNYSTPIAAGETTPPFLDSFAIDGAIADHTTTTTTSTTTTDENGNLVIETTTTTSFDLGEVRFVVEAEADGVQTHNAEEAMQSAWGYNIF